MQTNHLCQTAIDNAAHTAMRETPQESYDRQVNAAKRRARTLRDQAMNDAARAATLWLLRGFEHTLQRIELSIHRAIDAIQPQGKSA